MPNQLLDQQKVIYDQWIKSWYKCMQLLRICKMNNYRILKIYFYISQTQPLTPHNQ